MKKPTADKAKLLTGLLNVYADEVKAIYAIYFAWNQLKTDAQDKCIEDFDQALVARESLFEELADLKDASVDTKEWDEAIKVADELLLEQAKIVKEVYGLDVKAFLNIKQPKLLKKGK